MVTVTFNVCVELLSILGKFIIISTGTPYVPIGNVWLTPFLITGSVPLHWLHDSWLALTNPVLAKVR